MFIFVTGGARSGKSDFALGLAEKAGGELVYVATAAAGDAEMAERIARHKNARGSDWYTVEERIDITGALKAFEEPGHTVLIDCLTLWLSNLMGEAGEGFDAGRFESYAKDRAGELAGLIGKRNGTTVVVSNEVGMGIVPDNAAARAFRDAAGAVNRIMAGAADEVYLVVSGLPLRVKP